FLRPPLEGPVWLSRTTVLSGDHERGGRDPEHKQKRIDRWMCTPRGGGSTSLRFARGRGRTAPQQPPDLSSLPHIRQLSPGTSQISRRPLQPRIVCPLWSGRKRISRYQPYTRTAPLCLRVPWAAAESAASSPAASA